MAGCSHLWFREAPDSAEAANGDGLPDKGQTPILCVPGTTIDTRLPLLSPCKP